MNVEFFQEVRLPSKQFIFVIHMDNGQRFTWQSGESYSNRWRYIRETVAITKFSKEVNSSDVPLDKKKKSLRILFESFIERV